MILSILRLFNTILTSPGVTVQGQVKNEVGSIYFAEFTDAMGFRYEVIVRPIGRLQLNLDDNDLTIYDKENLNVQNR